MQNESVILKDMPIPPSLNQAYYTDFRHKTRHKSKDYRLFESMIKHWAAMFPAALGSARQFTTLLGSGQAFQVDITFYFPRTRVLTLPVRPCKKHPSGRPTIPKRNDTSNRIKIAHDCLAELLGIDDSYFWDGKFSKKVLNSDHPGFMDISMMIIDIDGY